MTDEVRLNKALADAGVCSRRKADELIFAGQVLVNRQVAESPGQRVVPGRDAVVCQGRKIELKSTDLAGEQSTWLLLNKPVQVVSSASDPEGRQTVLDLVPAKWRSKRLYPVGRLDYFSEGLILLTDDGQLANRLMHPRWHLPRVYLVRVRPEADALPLSDCLAAMRRGMTLAEGDRLAPVQVEQLAGRSGIFLDEPAGGRGVLLRLVLHQGVNRQVRRMCRDLGLTILRLQRVEQGPIRLGDLPPGQIRPLSAGEVRALRESVGLCAQKRQKNENTETR